MTQTLTSKPGKSEKCDGMKIVIIIVIIIMAIPKPAVRIIELPIVPMSLLEIIITIHKQVHQRTRSMLEEVG
jgi:hypothetical protein